MRNNLLPNDFAKRLMLTDDDDKPIVRIHTLKVYISEALHYLQNNQTSLNTADFVDAIIQSLDLDIYNVESNTVLTHALLESLLLTHRTLSSRDKILVDIITEWLRKQKGTYAAYSRYKAILTADYPMPSVLNRKKIAVWRNTSKMGNWDKRQAVSVRKWVSSTFREFTDEQVEDLSKRIDEVLVPPQVLDIRHHNSYDFANWEQAYSSGKIRSCMNPGSSSEVGHKRTFTCYCSGYHGLPDNGLTLTVLYQDDTPVARAITFSDDAQKYYIRSYGDDRLAGWLRDNGYEQSDFKPDTLLYTTEDLLKPFVDGALCTADHYSTSEGKHYWVLNKDGEYNLQTTDAYAYLERTCECCGYNYRTDEAQEVLSHVNHEYYPVCNECAERNSYTVYTARGAESQFFHDGDRPDTNRDYVRFNGEYYAIDSLDEYSLCLINGKVYHTDNLYYCEMTDTWFTDSDEVYTDAEQISTDQPVHFPYECVSREYWDDNVVETTCGTLALSDDTREISTPSLGDVCTLNDYWTIYTRRDSTGVSLTGIIFKLADIERDYKWEPTDKMKAFQDYAITYNTIQFLRFQELGI